jgi:hypothetical protein
MLAGAGPYLLVLVQAVLGYLHYAPGTAYSLSPDHYRAWAFPSFRYSDIIWLYLRDGLERRPIPYVDYPLEYPPLTGLASWAASLAPDLPAYFLLAYLTLAAAVLATVWALGRIPGANPWYVAAAPAVFFYTGHQWDPLAVAATALSLVAIARGRDRLGALGLAAAVSLKLFPLAFLAALCVERVRQRAWRRLAEIVALAGGATLLVNLPVALANRDGWGFFFRWNRDRLADSGPWVLLRGIPTESLTTASLLAAVLGAGAIALWALRLGGPLVAPLGSTALLWWLLVNKTFTTHLVLWVLLAVALLRPPVWLWLAAVLVDVGGFQLGNFLNLYNVPLYQSAPLVRQAVERLYDPLQLLRTLVLLACVGWGLRVIWRGRGITPPLLHPPPRTAADPTAAGVRVFAPSPAPSRRLRDAVLLAGGPLLLFAAVAVVASWPLAAAPRSTTVVGFDPLLQVWLSRWVQHALATDPSGLWGANIFHPFPDTLAYTDANLPGALLAWPLDLLLGDPLFTNTAMIVAAGAAGGFGVFLVVAGLTGNRAAGVVAGMAWVALPFRAVHLWHLNWLQGAWLPWVVLAFLRVLERPTVGRGVVLGLAATALTLTSFYFALQIAILLGALLLAALAANRRLANRAAATALLAALVVAAGVVAPFVAPYLRVRSEQGLERSIDEAERYKASPASYLTLPPWDRPNPLQRAIGVRTGVNDALATVGQARHADGHRHPEIVTEDALYPGAVVAALAVAGVALGRPRWLAFGLAGAAAAAFVLSLGPSLGAPGHGAVTLPYRWLFDHVPGFTAMRVPARLGGLVGLVLVLLAGIGLAAVWHVGRHRLEQAPVARSRPALARATPAALVAVTALLAVADLAAGPVPVEPVDRSDEAVAVYRWLADQPPGAVMEFPAESIFHDRAGSSVRRHVGLAMLGSTAHWKPLVNGNSGFIPHAHSELLETFVGNVPREDGSLALRVSHVAPDRLPLLRQLGVRYLVFHRSQYRPQDWAAVERRLGQIGGVVQPGGSFGEAAVWFVRDPVAPPPLPEVAVLAPTLLSEEGGWSPIVAARTALDGPSLLSLTTPARLAVTWYDAEGRRLRHEALPHALPPILAASHIRCNAAGCADAADLPFLDRLPAASAPGWRPSAPGHYTAVVELSGDVPVSCRVDIDVVASPAERRRLAPDNPLRWAACQPGDPIPVNDPGRPGLRLLGPSVTFADRALAVSAVLEASSAQEVRGWLLLGPPGDPEPWRRPAWRSATVQRLIDGESAAEVGWLERPDLPPGVYGLTLWFHRATASGWQHAEGGGFGLPNVVADEGGALRWSGPTRADVARSLGVLEPGRRSALPLTLSAAPADECTASWRLLDGEGTTVAGGGAGACATAGVAIPRGVPAGQYLLQVDIRVDDGDGPRLNDGTSRPVVVGDDRPGAR